MKNTIYLIISAITICSCGEREQADRSGIPENVVRDGPIILKEGQAFILMIEGDDDLMIGATVTDGKLSIADLDAEGRNFGVTWTDTNTWETSTIIQEEETTLIVMDRNGDGFPDYKAESTSAGLRRYERQDDSWVEIQPE
jgi:hypothetical protein